MIPDLIKGSRTTFNSTLTLTPTLAALAALQVLDVLTTWLGLRAGAVEQNPYPAALIEAGGVGELAAVKLVAFLGVAWIVGVMPAWSRGVWRLVLGGACVVTAFVIVSNVGVALR